MYSHFPARLGSIPSIPLDSFTTDYFNPNILWYPMGSCKFSRTKYVEKFPYTRSRCVHSFRNRKLHIWFPNYVNISLFVYRNYSFLIAGHTFGRLYFYFLTCLPPFPSFLSLSLFMVLPACFLRHQNKWSFFFLHQPSDGFSKQRWRELRQIHPHTSPSIRIRQETGCLLVSQRSVVVITAEKTFIF